MVGETAQILNCVVVTQVGVHVKFHQAAGFRSVPFMESLIKKMHKKNHKKLEIIQSRVTTGIKGAD